MHSSLLLPSSSTLFAFRCCSWMLLKCSSVLLKPLYAFSWSYANSFSCSEIHEFLRTFLYLKALCLLLKSIENGGCNFCQKVLSGGFLLLLTLTYILKVKAVTSAGEKAVIEQCKPRKVKRSGVCYLGPKTCVRPDCCGTRSTYVCTILFTPCYQVIVNPLHQMFFIMIICKFLNLQQKLNKQWLVDLCV